MEQCYCQFDLLKVPDIKTKDDEIYHVTVLISKMEKHDCVFLPKRIPENVRFSLNDLSTIKFLKADNVLKRRFYTICPPIQRKRLWNCSRTCANLGKKPTTLIARAFLARRASEPSPVFMNTCHMIPSTISIVSTRTNQVILDNFVMDLRFYFYFALDSQKMAELTKFVDFNQTYVRFDNGDDLTSFYPLIFTPKVTTLLLYGDPRDLSPIWPLLPNLGSVSANNCIRPISFQEITNCPELFSIWISISEPLDYSMAAKFLQNQRSNLWLTFFCSFELDLNDMSLLEHFVPVEKDMLDHKGLCLKINSNLNFFELR